MLLSYEGTQLGAGQKPISELLYASVSKRVLVHNHSNGNELRILMQIKLISLTIVEHQDSLRNRDKQQLGNGLFVGLISLYIHFGIN